jgi:hypothetical protein
MICFLWMNLPPSHHSRRDRISHRGPDKISLEHQEKRAFLPMWTDHHFPASYGEMPKHEPRSYWMTVGAE